MTDWVSPGREMVDRAFAATDKARELMERLEAGEDIGTAAPMMYLTYADVCLRLAELVPRAYPQSWVTTDG